MTEPHDADLVRSVLSVRGVTYAALRDLAAPTPPAEIQQRIAWGKDPDTGRAAPQRNPDGTTKMLDYVDARFVQERLDDVVGPANWQSQYQDTAGGVRCSIGILIMGEWVWKTDVGIPSNIEPVKGAHSDAFKRAAVQWGIARDLYGEREDDEPPTSSSTVRETVATEGRPSRYASPAPRAVAAKAPPKFTQEELEAFAAAQGAYWDCPIHGSHKIVPPGISRAGRPYGAFFGCTDRACKETGPSIRTPKTPDEVEKDAEALLATYPS